MNVEKVLDYILWVVCVLSIIVVIAGGVWIYYYTSIHPNCIYLGIFRGLVCY